MFGVWPHTILECALRARYHICMIFNNNSIMVLITSNHIISHQKSVWANVSQRLRN